MLVAKRLYSEAEAVFLDLDGTLFDTRLLAVYAFRHALRDLGQKHHLHLPEVSDRELLATVGHPGTDQAHMILPAELVEYAPELHSLVQHHEGEFVRGGQAQLFDGARELLAQLRTQSFRTFLASNCSVRYRDLVLGHFDLFPLFDGPYCIGMFPGGTKADMVMAILDREGVRWGFTIGDRSSDIEAGAANGLATVACRYGFGRADELAGADFVVGSLAELRHLLHRRNLVMEDVARLVATAARPQLAEGRHSVVAVTGPDAAGKTTFAGELGARLKGRGLSVLVVHLDDFHRPGRDRSGEGLAPPEAYYRLGFDWERLGRQVLEPAHTGTQHLAWEVFDLEHDKITHLEEHDLRNPTVLILEGVFLLRPEVRDRIDYSLLLECGDATILRRASRRDGYLFGSEKDIRERYQAKYLPGQRLYESLCSPHDRASLVINNNDPDWPRVVRR